MNAWDALGAVYALVALPVVVMATRAFLRSVAARGAREAWHRGWTDGFETGADLHQKGERIRMRERLLNR